MLRADLHVHSHYSDGADSVEAVVKRAKRAGLDAISFVDHDTVAGWTEKQSIAARYGITAIPGIEISAYDFRRSRKVHILGYQFEPAAGHIQELCSTLLEQRHGHSLWQIEQIKAAGFKLDADAVMASAKPSTAVYKQHIMKQLTEEPYTSPQYKTLYKSLFKGNGPASGDISYVDARDAVRAIVADKGLAVLAHPGQLDSFELVPELVEAGLGGIERNHFDHSEDDHLKVEELAREYGLALTGGSDYHGSFGALIDVGDIISPADVNYFKRL